MSIEEKITRFRKDFERLQAEVHKAIVGHEEVVEFVLLALISNGHILLEGVPGLGKTYLVKSLSESLNLGFSRIQFTPDLMPADIIGTTVVNEENNRKVFSFQKGAVFSNIILADEINRATPKTQSALLEAMQERTVTLSGTRHELPAPFIVLATQNPIEMEGTYPLPEAQLDRFFFKLIVRSPEMKGLIEIIDRTTGESVPEISAVLSGEDILEMQSFARSVPVPDHVKEYAVRLVLATHPETDHSLEMSKKYVRYGSSPRGCQALISAAKVNAVKSGRSNVSFGDVRRVVTPALRHRIILNFEGEAEGIVPDEIVSSVVREVPELPQRVEQIISDR